MIQLLSEQKYWMCGQHMIFIYEDIVNRQRDPSILYKLSPTKYQLRIFPLMKQSLRKIKLTYLVPNSLAYQTVAVTVPTNFI